ncbi:MAG TPA: CDP-archaeol synthase [Patescibacteria group bacterium]|nr:CDP-archaeol synthase [Patescibacteria group bacterium]
MTFYLQIIWLFLPVGIANIFASLSRHLFPQLDYPLDFGKTFRGRRIFGSHKTWRGLIVGLAAAFLFFLWQKYLYNSYPSIRSFSLIDYNSVNTLIGLIMGLGAIIGDAIKSFFKRQFNIAPGYPWFPFDQLDFVVGGVLLSWPFIPVSVNVILVAILLGLLFHLLFKILGHILRVDKTLI